MIYSVLDRGSRQYDYYETPEAEPWHSPPPPKAKTSSPLGAIPEDAAWKLPAGARRVGRGERPKGRIAVTHGSPTSLGDLMSDAPVIGLAAAALYFITRK